MSSTIKKPQLKCKQRGQNITFVYKETSRSKEQKYTLKVEDKEKRDTILDKINGYISKVDKTNSELVVSKNSKTLINLFTKEGKALKAKTEDKKAVDKAKSRNFKKENKSLVATTRKKTNALSRLNSQIGQLTETDKEELARFLEKTNEETSKVSRKNKKIVIVGKSLIGEY